LESSYVGPRLSGSDAVDRLFADPKALRYGFLGFAKPHQTANASHRLIGQFCASAPLATSRSAMQFSVTTILGVGRPDQIARNVVRSRAVEVCGLRSRQARAVPRFANKPVNVTLVTALISMQLNAQITFVS
jgi:hypothetical protein